MLKNKTGRSRAMILKIDLEKAYDRLEWRFIKQTLIDVGLLQMMVNVIMECLSNASFRPSRNGECIDIIQ